MLSSQKRHMTRIRARARMRMACGWSLPLARASDFQQAKADHDFNEQELELKPTRS
jgi:hypothetical protein